MRTVIAASILLVGCTHPTPSPAPAPDPIDRAIARGEETVEAFFGGPVAPYTRRVFDHRDAMAAFARDTSGIPELPCWAVAMGTGTTLVVLAPQVWPTEACDHADATELDAIVAHELVHVWHGQHRPDDPEMNDVAEDAGWFVEGLAVYASGQLDDARRAQAHDAARPAALAEVWSGPARYALAGTLVELVDQRLGRDGTIALLPASTGAEILAALGLTEAELLEAWAAAL